MSNYLPHPISQYADEQTPRGSLARALDCEYPYALPADKVELAGFVARWVLSQDTDKPYLGMGDATVVLENWFLQRKAGLS